MLRETLVVSSGFLTFLAWRASPDGHEKILSGTSPYVHEHRLRGRRVTRIGVDGRADTKLSGGSNLRYLVADGPKRETSKLATPQKANALRTKTLRQCAQIE
jgi:hypothetical protein